MRTTPWQMLLLAMAGWINRYQQAKLEFCLEQIRIYKQLHGGKPLRLNDDQRRRLAAKGKELGLTGLRELGALVTPETIMRWHRELIARKYDGSAARMPGRPRVDTEVRQLIVEMAAVSPENVIRSIPAWCGAAYQRFDLAQSVRNLPTPRGGRRFTQPGAQDGGGRERLKSARSTQAARR